ncbi:MAG: VWA domain-containing protein [Verrucomicrobia bacterium]|nr:VWA domain-containing protein [Verrucomicrobiota bacterium]
MKTVNECLLGALAVTGLALWFAGCKVHSPKNVSLIPGAPTVSRAPASADSQSPRLLPAIPGGLPSPDEELWIIARHRTSRPPADDDTPRFGALMTKEAEREVPLPLKHTDVQATVNGYIASVHVRQQFQNPYTAKIEAVYVFPLPENAAVNDFVMIIGERHIRGVIRERAEAEQIYAEAKAQGYTASLLTQERPNIFTQSVANIEPGREIDVAIRYLHTLAYDDGWFEFVFPMVVGPRFNPPGYRKGIGAVPAGASATGDGWTSDRQPRTNVAYLPPNQTSAHRVSLKLDLHAPEEEHACPSHQVEVTPHGAEHVTFTLKDAVPDKDFVLRYRIAGDRLKTHFRTHRDERGGFFTLMLVPPQRLEQLGRQPLELVFVLDCSGSMSGEPIRQAKAAVAHALQQLRPDDTFQLINFSSHASQLGARPLPATPENVRRGLRHLAALAAEGGTMMLTGIKAALDFPHDPRRLRFVVFLTDGFIGNDEEILHEVDKRLGDARVFSFGVGQAPNRYLLDAMAKLGRGAVAYLSLDDEGAEVMDRFFARVAHPVLTHVKIDWDGLAASEVYPRRLPDLFVGRPVFVAGRFDGRGPQTLRLTGRVGDEKLELKLPVNAEVAVADAHSFSAIWARMKIADLYDQHAWTRNPFLKRDVKKVALDFNLMSAFTAFVAVDATERTAGDFGTTVPVAVPVPEGVRYETTVK